MAAEGGAKGSIIEWQLSNSSESTGAADITSWIVAPSSNLRALQVNNMHTICYKKNLQMNGVVTVSPSKKILVSTHPPLSF